MVDWKGLWEKITPGSTSTPLTAAGCPEGGQHVDTDGTPVRSVGKGQSLFRCDKCNRLFSGTGTP